MSDDTAHIIVTGLVQGVGFRYFVSRKAVALGLRGYVRNLTDGSVEVVARGRRGLILELVGNLKTGPRSSSVSAVILDWVRSPENFERFEIR